MKCFRFAFLCRVTILNGSTLTEVRFDHDWPIEEADLTILFNGREPGHYSSICKFCLDDIDDHNGFTYDHDYLLRL